MTDTTTNTATGKPKREAIAVRDWIDANGNPVETGKEINAVGFRYIHLPSAKKLLPTYNPETDAPPVGSYYDCVPAGQMQTWLALFGGLTLAGNIVNSETKGEKGDPNADVIAAIKARFEEMTGESAQWTDRTGGVGGVRYDREKLAASIASIKGESDPAPYLEKMATKVDPKSGATVPNDTKGAISYGAFALGVPEVKAAYDKLTGTGRTVSQL